MKPITGLIFLCIILLFATAGKANSGEPSNSDLISSLCKLSEDQNFCVSSLQTPPDSGDVATTSDQIEIVAISAASANASSTAVYIKERLRQDDLEPAVEATLEDCQKNYQDASEQLDDSIAALLANAYADVDVWLSAAISAVESCDGALGSRARLDSELSRRNAIFLKLCKNALMINKKLT